MDRQADAALKRAIGMLEAVLTREAELHRSMLEVADKKRESIIKGDLNALEEAVAEEKRLVAGIEEEEEKRRAVTPLVKRGLGLETTEEKLSEIVEALPEPERERLGKLRELLKSLIEDCRVKTRHNAELLKASLEHVEAFIKTVAESIKPDVGYRKDGKKSGGGPSLLDRNA